MRIKKLEIQGFKSFADRASLLFGDGITGVVGPNGCGKSNVVDAIRWCMGEMSAKHLRGRAMQDVIFAGSDSRGPLGMAEVTLTFHNDGNSPPEYAPFSEIAVTRRLHRDGSSEYLVNRVPARLRDITDLFLGTGAGTRAYSIIEQGRIGFVVSARPEDRRSLIEEVAGITRFKARKKAAERRFEATEQNLLRVNDIVSELERQLGSLRRQARKAERYRELREQLRDLELHGASLEHLKLTVLQNVQCGERQRLETAIEDQQVALAASEAGVEGNRLRLAEEERALMQEQSVAAEIDTKVAALERDLTHWKEQIKESGDRAQTARRDLEEARARLWYTELERVEAVQAAEGYEREVGAFRENIAKVVRVAAETQAALAAVEAEIERLRGDALEHVHGAAQGRAQAKNLERQRLETRSRLEQAASEHALVVPRHVEIEAKRAQLADDLTRIRHELQMFRERISDLRQQAEQVSSEAVAKEAALATLRDELSNKRSRLASLEEIARRFEGYSDGVRTLLGVRDDSGEPQEGTGPVVAGIRALVSDVLSVTPAYEQAIEAALGARVQYLVVDSIDDAATAIGFLKQSVGGRSGFVPLHLSAPNVAKASAAIPGVLGAARMFVTPAAGYESIADYLLGDVLIADSLETALRLYADPSTAGILSGMVVVSKDGDVIDRGGLVSGGAVEGAGLLQKRREIRELAAAVERLESDYQAQRTEQEAMEARRLQLEIDVQQLDKDARQSEIELIQTQKDQEATDKEFTRLGERMEVLTYELSQRQEELQSIDEEERAALALAERAEASHQESEQKLAALAETRRERTSELEARKNALTEAKVQLAAHEEKLAAALASAERLKLAHAELAARIERDEATMSDSEVATNELSARVNQATLSLEQHVADAQSRHAHLSEARGHYDTERGAMSDIEHSLRQQRQALTEMQQALLSVRMESQRLSLEQQRLVEQVAERYDIDLLAVLCDYHLRALPDAQCEERRIDLDRSIRAMGPINLTAIEECAEIEGRHQFLVRQRDDLSAALDTLKRAIQRINRQSRERFREAFDAVNEMFQQVFPRLFRGGEARLDLIDNGDVLEAGVDIVAQPPGKKLQNVMLLSGGEKALTATALVFAIFLIKPSPFCVLDEVDAPLDEANVGRFNEMLREISKLSQFIVITHNKLTMTEADRLYGITMEEPGMSKVVSVDMTKQSNEVAA